MKLFIIAVCVVLAAARPQSEWLEWKAKHNKQYETDQEEMDRFDIWQGNLEFINAHNAKGLSYEVAMNEFGDMTDEEFADTILTEIGPPLKSSNASLFVAEEGVELADNVDWRTKGYVTEVKNQGSCGSCWAFSATGSLEGQHFKKTGDLVSLSEQNLMDCSTAEGNHGCKGGLMDSAFEYIERNHGVDTEESYPYTAKNGICRFRESDVGATDSGYVDISRGDEDQLQEAVATIGPISIAMDASHSSFRFYKRGVYYERECSSTKLDHGVLAVGYGTEEMEPYWLVKNSWGTRWGNEGYFMIARNKGNNCGIATQASYPKV